MANKKKTKTTKGITPKTKTAAKAVRIPKEKTLTVKQSLYQNLFEQLKLGESYVSLILGAVVVFAVFLIIFMFIKQGSMKNNPIKTNNSIKTTITTQPKTYVLQEGEGLWDVAVKFYGDGFKWTEIAKANHLEDTADYVEPGTRLIIPNVK